MQVLVCYICHLFRSREIGIYIDSNILVSTVIRQVANIVGTRE